MATDTTIVAMGEQELAAFMGAEFMMRTVAACAMSTRAGGDRQSVPAGAQNELDTSHLPPATPSTGPRMMIAMLADKPAVYKA